jgi:hypothetical protein
LILKETKYEYQLTQKNAERAGIRPMVGCISSTRLRDYTQLALGDDAVAECDKRTGRQRKLPSTVQKDGLFTSFEKMVLVKKREGWRAPQRVTACLKVI